MTDHGEVKKKISKKLTKWYDISVTEYPIGGRVIDGYSVTRHGVSIAFEVIWGTSTSYDIPLIMMAGAMVKLVFTKKELLKDRRFRRIYDKLVVHERGNRVAINEKPFDASKVIDKPRYLENLRKKIDNLIIQAESYNRSRPIIFLDNKNVMVRSIDRQVMGTVGLENRAFYVNRLIVTNVGSMQASQCKGSLIIGDEEFRVCWYIPSERKETSINPREITYLDLCAVRDDNGMRIAPTENGWADLAIDNRRLPLEDIDASVKITASNALPILQKIKITNVGNGTIVQFASSTMES